MANTLIEALFVSLLVLAFVSGHAKWEKYVTCDEGGVPDDRIKMADCITVVKTFNRTSRWLAVQEITERKSCNTCLLEFESVDKSGIAIPPGAVIDAAWNIITTCSSSGGVGHMQIYQGTGGETGILTISVRNGGGELCDGSDDTDTPDVPSSRDSTSDSSSDS
ncbi:hypothetical protein CROQUDRAFT_660777 [Cronartium quercuum f. sp. fusiforme G11]|uniref:Secreted protein n=1 Tax=Cronartium quercuum f. sp. fusiforme G11 TaxID=708437 RepID=A0A9P6NDW2_9BASI|nr:hypothetical protein CROQUDRAFT_660777 [Cronartium quercuum f. sp. fusiforme G11]